MPTSTFNNLNEEKKKKIIDSALKEFSTYLYSDISINRIIKNSNIPRGSFYMYFLNKEDLYFYIMDTYRKKSFAIFVNVLESQDGDIFATFALIYDMIIKEISASSYLKNIILNMDYIMENRLVKKRPTHCDNFHMNFINKINRKYLRLSLENDIDYMLQILIPITIHSLIEYIKEMDNRENVLNGYKRKLELLKYGFYKEDL